MGYIDLKPKKYVFEVGSILCQNNSECYVPLTLQDENFVGREDAPKEQNIKLSGKK